jgi:cytochrome c oxidase subunit 2
LLSGLFFWSDIVVVRSTAAPTIGSTRLRIHVIGHQWWWEAHYSGTKAITANEIHIPVRTRVDIVATTDDVIHSFWIPQLNRKIDLIPGRGNHVLLAADEPGIYEGECAEFCGLQHAHMFATVIADPGPVFRRWLDDMAKPARAPSKPSEERGRGVFLDEGCAECHRIRGTAADGDVGPDLTHLATRRELAAGTLANDYVHLAGWVADPQRFKPGNRMPEVPMSGDDFNSLIDYLQSLK